MKQEDKELLLTDLCARLHYGVFLKIGEYSDYTLQGIVPSNANKPLVVKCNGSDFECSIEVVKPYLRPMSSMTEDERKEYNDIVKNTIDFYDCPKSEEICFFIIPIDWLNAHHFDYRGLIEKGLAIEVTEEMYNIKEQ